MIRWISLTLVALVVASPIQAGGITGLYLEARTCEVYGGPCFANADTGLTGRNAVMAWRIDQGSLDNVSLDGLGIVAVISAPDTIGLRQVAPARAILIVDERATPAQKSALIRLARTQGGELVRNVVNVQSASIELTFCPCKENGCARLVAGLVRVETRCIDPRHDATCDNAVQLYPPIAAGLANSRAATTVEHSYTGTALNETWRDHGRRSAYLASFEMR
jgi:hypothetical protein